MSRPRGGTCSRCLPARLNLRTLNILMMSICKAPALIEARAGADLVGVIGYLPYDHRFAQFDYGDQRVVEVVRLFVLPAYRRHGVAARLFGALQAQAASEEIDRFYLHTHPFLPGAVSFWERQGFTLLQVEDDPVWQTTHMDLRLR